MHRFPSVRYLIKIRWIKIHISESIWPRIRKFGMEMYLDVLWVDLGGQRHRWKAKATRPKKKTFSNHRGCNYYAWALIMQNMVIEGLLYRQMGSHQHQVLHSINRLIKCAFPSFPTSRLDKLPAQLTSRGHLFITTSKEATTVNSIIKAQGV